MAGQTPPVQNPLASTPVQPAFPDMSIALPLLPSVSLNGSPGALTTVTFTGAGAARAALQTTTPTSPASRNIASTVENRCLRTRPMSRGFIRTIPFPSVSDVCDASLPHTALAWRTAHSPLPPDSVYNGLDCQA